MSVTPITAVDSSTSSLEALMAAALAIPPNVTVAIAGDTPTQIQGQIGQLQQEESQASGQAVTQLQEDILALEEAEQAQARTTVPPVSQEASAPTASTTPTHAGPGTVLNVQA